MITEELKKPLMWMGLRFFALPILFVSMMMLAKMFSERFGMAQSGRWGLAVLGVSPMLLYSKYLFKYDIELVANQKIPFIVKALVVFGAFGLGIGTVMVAFILLHSILR